MSYVMSSFEEASATSSAGTYCDNIYFCSHNEAVETCGICNECSLFPSSSLGHTKSPSGNFELDDSYFVQQPSPSSNDNHQVLEHLLQPPWSAPRTSSTGKVLETLEVLDKVLPDSLNPHVTPQYEEPEELAGIESRSIAQASDTTTRYPPDYREHYDGYASDEILSYRAIQERDAEDALGATPFYSQRIPRPYPGLELEQTSVPDHDSQQLDWNSSVTASQYAELDASRYGVALSDQASLYLEGQTQDALDPQLSPDVESRDTTHRSDSAASAQAGRERCKQCGEWFVSVRSHKRKHDKKIACKTCGRLFSGNRDRIRHEQTHKSANERASHSVRCQYCGDRFTRSDNLIRHENRPCKSRPTTANQLQ